MKSLWVTFVFFLFSFLYFSTCTNEDSNTVVPTQKSKPFSLNKGDALDHKNFPKEIYDSVYGKLVLDTSRNIVEPKSMLCEYTEYYWSFHHYAPKTNRFIGTWPRASRYNSVQRLRDLKDIWGFSYLLFVYVGDNNKWSMVNSAGFNLNKVMIALTAIPDANRANIINQYGNAFAYYVGEPADQGNSMGGVRNALNQYGFSSLFIIDGYKRTSALNNCVNLADKVLFSSYDHWWPCGVPPAWCSCCPINTDQRYDWTDMKIRYGSKFTMSWIGAHKDYGSYGDLFSCASGLGLDIVWFYQAQDEMDDYTNDNIGSFCYNGFRNGYLRRFEMEWAVKYRCDKPNCECVPEEWKIVSYSTTGNIREVFP